MENYSLRSKIMNKPRYKYTNYDAEELYCKIMSKTKFTPYEFMAFRYACCHIIDRKTDYYYFCNLLQTMDYEERKQFDIKRKKDVKLLQQCISYLDKIYNEKGINL